MWGDIFVELLHFSLKIILQKSPFMYATYCELCPLSLISTVNILYVYKPLHVMSFDPNPVKFQC
ncbi:hypothetical protein Hanom_Chr05g00405881 [Helianthus anomalus]